MITIDKTPPQLGFAGNPMLYKVISDNELATQGVMASLALYIYTPDTVAGHSFSIAFGVNLLTFVSAANPDDSGLQYPIAVPGDTFRTWAIKLFTALQSNYLLMQFFDISVLTDPLEPYAEINIVAKQSGVNYSMTFTNITTAFAVDSNFAGVDEVARENFAIIGAIWDANFKKIAEDIKSVSDLGEATFDFSEYLSAVLDSVPTSRFTFPELSGVFLKSFDTFYQQYYASFGEKYSATTHKLLFDDLRTAISGGLNRESLVYYNQLVTDFFAIPANFFRFLTWAPLLKVTAKNVPEKLYFLVPEKPSYLQLKVQILIHFTSGTTTQIDATALTDASPLSVIECMVGADHLSLSTVQPSLTISRYDVWLVNESNVRVSEIRMFEIDPTFYENERIFIFENSFGRAYDVVRFTGRGEVNLEIDHSTGTLELSENYSQFNAPSKKFSASESQKMVASSGWISAEMKDYLRELLLSRNVYEIKNNLLYPMIITNQKVTPLFIDGEFLYDLELEYDRAYRDFFFLNF